MRDYGELLGIIRDLRSDEMEGSMARLWDEKDVQIIAGVIKQIAPDDTGQRADLILHAAWEAGVRYQDIRAAMVRWIQPEER